jgi:hypothetical protein
MLVIREAIEMFLIYVVMFLLSFIPQQTNCWRGITPLRSTRADVEKKLGMPTADSKASDAAFYKTRDEKVFILYSTGPCDSHPGYSWNAPRGTVIHISVEPNIRPKFADIKLDENKFKKRPDPELRDYTAYTNEEDGISIEVNTSEGVVTAFNYWPTSKDDSLRCSTFLKKSPKPSQ